MSNPENRKQQTPGDGYTPGRYLEESVLFLREHISKKDFETIMHSADRRAHPYVAARVFLSEADWKKYVWIEHNGSLDGFGE